MKIEEIWTISLSDGRVVTVGASTAPGPCVWLHSDSGLLSSSTPADARAIAQALEDAACYVAVRMPGALQSPRKRKRR